MAETFFTIYTGEAGRVDIGYDYTQNVANNTTALTVKAYLVKTNGAYTSFNNYHKTFTLTVNGTATLIAFDFDFRNMSTGVRYLITTASRTISHNSDGSVGNVPVSVYYKSDTSGLGTVSGSTSIAISTIPRASTPTLSATTTAIGSAVTINTNRASTSFTHAITYSFGSASGTIATGVGTSYSWTLPASLANQTPNTTSGSGSIKLKTYSGTTLIGEKSIAFTATVPDTSAFQPTASGLTASISGSGRDKTIGKYVQSISKVYMSFSSTANGGATIKSNSINIKKGTSTNSMTINGTSGTSGTVTSSGVYTITATTTDSRGRSKITSITITVEAYAVPKITSFTASRQSTTKTSVSTVRNGTYTYMSNSNPLSVVIARRPRGGSYTNLNTTAGTTSGTFLGTYVSTGNAETYSYDFKLTITDSFGNSAVSEITVPTSSVALSIAGDVGIGVGKIHEQGALDVAGAIVLNGENIESKFQDKLRVGATGSTVYYIKIAEMTTVIGSGRTQAGFLISGLGNFGSAVFSTDIVHMSTRGNSPTLRFNRLVSGTGGAYYGSVVNSSTGKSELWMKLDNYNYDISIIPLVSGVTGGTVETGILATTTTQPAGFTPGFTDYDGKGIYGSNSNGSYLKLSNGVLICWGTQSYGYVNTSWYDGSWQFPHAFVATPNVAGNRSAGNIGNLYVNAASLSIDGTLTSAYGRLFGPAASMPSGLSPTVGIIAIGRWY